MTYVACTAWLQLTCDTLGHTSATKDNVVAYFTELSRLGFHRSPFSCLGKISIVAQLDFFSKQSYT